MPHLLLDGRIQSLLCLPHGPKGCAASELTFWQACAGCAQRHWHFTGKAVCQGACMPPEALLALPLCRTATLPSLVPAAACAPAALAEAPADEDSSPSPSVLELLHVPDGGSMHLCFVSVYCAGLADGVCVSDRSVTRTC
jgi:hypothetical protein